MTYNQLITTLQTLLESHAMIKTAKNVTPQEWLNRKTQPVYPVATYTVNNGSFNTGQEQVYSVQMFFLDKSGAEAEYETDVISDQVQTAGDIIALMRSGKKPYFIDDNIGWEAVADKYEDYLAGVELTINITTLSDFNACDVPTV